MIDVDKTIYSPLFEHMAKTVAKIKAQLEAEGMPAELPIEHQRKMRKLKFLNGKKACMQCGFRIRGRHHDSGEHHRQGQGSKGHCTITKGMR